VDVVCLYDMDDAAHDLIAGQNMLSCSQSSPTSLDLTNDRGMEHGIVT
jgi:hypothetical protein